MKCAALFFCMVLAACSANHNSIYRMRPLANSASTITTIDAKQRVILASPATAAQSGGPPATMRFCAEPSPDVFSVIAQAASASGSFGQSADPKSIEAAAGFAYSSAEQGSTIPRTQTINMLREAMYRTCERYLNGSLTRLEMPIQAVRDQRLMVATLAIEQLTGAVTARPVIISAASGASTGAVAQEAVVRVDEAYRQLQVADATQRARQTDHDTIADAEPKCSAIKTKVDAGTALEPAETTKQQECAKAESDLATAQSARVAAQVHYDTLKKVASEGGTLTSATATTGSASNQGGLDRAHDESVIRVAAAVEHIVDSNYAQDEFLLLCLKVFSNGNDREDLKAEIAQRIEKTCQNYVEAIIRRQQAEADAKSEQFRLLESRLASQRLSAQIEIAPVITDQFAIFWSEVADTPASSKANSAKLSARINAFSTRQPRRLARQDLLDRLKRLSHRDDMEKAFGKLPPFMREGLIQ